jgi:3'-phosphoadenosine 5'-phosphosulfate sulfotransferase (PAPS reductase)/FAD synthetase
VTRDQELLAAIDQTTEVVEGFRWYDRIVDEHDPSHLFGLFSGGHDSVCSVFAAAQHPAFRAAVHINTGTGIPETREYVYEVCRQFGWPLIEMHPDGKTYPELVREKGFPYGPKGHNTMYYWLKQRQVRRLVREHKTHRHDRIALVTGIRLAESTRRMGQGISQPIRRDGSQLWLNPILYWLPADKNYYMELNGIPRNPTVDLLEKSGECLCGAYANRKAEWPDIKGWFPEVAERIEALELEVEQAGIRECRWATKIRSDEARVQAIEDNPLCVQCANQIPVDMLIVS